MPNFGSGKDEIWDVRDAHGNPTGRTHPRGVPLAFGDFHLVVQAWVLTPDGRILLTRRSPSKQHYPSLWECTTGCALAGEDSETAARRELLEETGIVFIGAMEQVLTRLTADSIYDVWIARREVRLDDLDLPPSEVSEARLVALPQFRSMLESGEIVPFLGYFLELVREGKIRLEAPPTRSAISDIFLNPKNYQIT